MQGVAVASAHSAAFSTSHALQLPSSWQVPALPWPASQGRLHTAWQCRARPGLAMSQDGRNWARIEGPHHTGALFDVGQDGEPDATFAASPQVLISSSNVMQGAVKPWSSERDADVAALGEPACDGMQLVAAGQAPAF